MTRKLVCSPPASVVASSLSLSSSINRRRHHCTPSPTPSPRQQQQAVVSATFSSSSSFLPPNRSSPNISSPPPTSTTSSSSCSPYHLLVPGVATLLPCGAISAGRIGRASFCSSQLRLSPSVTICHFPFTILHLRSCHFASHSRFFTNRFHKKICPNCAKPNILPRDVCTFCQQTLPDSSVRPVDRDPFIDAVLAQPTNKYQEQIKKLAHSSPSSSSSNSSRAPPSSPSPPVLSFSQFDEVHRSFRFLAFHNPYPVAAVHLCVLPKSTLYDIKQLRPSHVKMLKAMCSKVESLLPRLCQEALLKVRTQLRERRGTAGGGEEVGWDGMGDWQNGEGNEEASCLPFCRPLNCSVGQESDRRLSPHWKTSSVVSAVRTSSSVIHTPHTPSSSCPKSSSSLSPTSSCSSSSSSSSLCSPLVSSILDRAIFGFNYPSEYNHLCLHVAVPPLLMSCEQFAPPYFYPLTKVVQDLQNFGQVQTFAPLGARERLSRAGAHDPIVRAIHKADAEVRQLIVKAEEQALLLLREQDSRAMRKKAGNK
eukprot:GHVS01092087.1.p1 GENE.GHVS01092087.1~~GHVS01092087.1.p1  ORF type:complete len:536 (+),score=141.73 GHVS01092087.1:111-1718(+)